MVNWTEVDGARPIGWMILFRLKGVDGRGKTQIDALTSYSYSSDKFGTKLDSKSSSRHA